VTTENKNKTVEYVVKGDGVFLEAFVSLSGARTYVRDLSVILGITNMPATVQIIKVISVSITMNEYVVEPSVNMTSVDTFDGIDLA